jgi:hypothetical protein
MVRSPTITDAEARRRLSLVYDILIQAAQRRRRRLTKQQAAPDAGTSKAAATNDEGVSVAPIVHDDNPQCQAG